MRYRAPRTDRRRTAERTGETACGQLFKMGGMTTGEKLKLLVPALVLNGIGYGGLIGVSAGLTVADLTVAARGASRLG